MRIAQAGLRAAELGNVQLQLALDGANANIDAQVKSIGEGVQSLNRLIGVINLFMGLVGLEPLPDLANLGTDAHAALEPIDLVVEQLDTARSTILA